MITSINCHQSVYGKYDLINSRVGQNPFRVIGISGDFIDLKELENNILSRISIGTNPDLNKLDSFSLMGPMSNGFYVLSHHLRSPEKEKDRNYYEFTHSVFIESTKWADISKDLQNIVLPEISSGIYHPYTKTETLRLVTFESQLPTVEKQAKSVMTFLDDDTRDNYLLILDGLLELPNVMILNYPDNIRAKLSLLSAIRFLLPRALVQHFTFATQVYPDPTSCFARIKFLESSRGIDKENSFVIDWSVANRQYNSLKRNYSTVVQMFRNQGEKGILELIQLVEKADKDGWSNISRQQKIIDEPRALGLASELSQNIQGWLGVDDVVANIQTADEGFSILSTYPPDKIKSSSKLVIFIFTKNQTKHEIERIANFLCKDAYSFGPQFWTELIKGLSPSSQDANSFLLFLWKKQSLVSIAGIENLLKTWFRNSVIQIAKTSAQDALSLINELKKAKIWNEEQLLEAYLAVFAVNPRRVILFNLLKDCRGTSPGELYQKIMRDKNFNIQLQEFYPPLFGIFSSFVNTQDIIPVSDYQNAINYFQGEQELYFLIVHDNLSIAKLASFQLEFFQIFLDRKLFGGKGISLLLEIFNQRELLPRFSPIQIGALAYLSLCEKALKSNGEFYVDLLLDEARKQGFILGFIRLGLRDNNNISELTNKLVQFPNIKYKNLLSALLLLLRDPHINRGLLKCTFEVYTSLVDSNEISGMESLTILSRLKEISGSGLCVDSIAYTLRDLTKNFCNETDLNLEKSREEFIEVIQSLRSFGYNDDVVASYLSIELDKNFNISPRFRENLKFLIDGLRNELGEHNIWHYEFSLRKYLGVQEIQKVEDNIILQTKSISPANRNQQAIASLQDNKVEAFVELLKDWKPPEQEFSKLIKSYWRPPYFTEVRRLIDRLTEAGLEEPYVEVVETCLVSGQIDCQYVVRVDYIKYLLEKVIKRLSFLQWIDVEKLPHSLQSYSHSLEFMNTIEQIQKLIFKGTKSLVSLEELLSILKRRLESGTDKRFSFFKRRT